MPSPGGAAMNCAVELQAAAASEVAVEVADAVLGGTLAAPEHRSGIVVFAHGSGSSRFSPRNRGVARSLNGVGFATLLLDLLTADEHARDALTAEYRFDIGLLAERLEGAVEWAAAQPQLAGLPLGLFGASTGAAAALIAAAEQPGRIGAVVSRGGRPDLAAEMLPRVRAPTLLVVGGEDREVIGLNRAAAARMVCEKELAIVPGATHLFEEPGALEEVARLAGAWFRRYLGRPSGGREPHAPHLRRVT